MRTKRIVSAMLALALVLSLASPALAASYRDTSGHWAESYIETATGRELFAGTGDYMFEPEGVMDRAMAVTVLWRLVGKPAYESIPQFTDVAAESWYSAALRWAARCEIVTGDGDGLFRPHDPVTREELVTMTIRALQIERADLFDGTYESPEYYAANWLEWGSAEFGDGASGSQWAAHGLGWATAVGVYEGDDNGLLRPGDALTRAEAAAVLCRLLVILGEDA